jgi:anti-sigma regulatory factor (Ser/Thr protein kinase)
MGATATAPPRGWQQAAARGDPQHGEGVLKDTRRDAGDRDGYARSDTAPGETRESAGSRLRLALDLPPGPRYVSCLRCTARSLFESLSLPRTDIDDIELILGELATNVVLHAGGGGYHVEVEVDGDAVRVTVSDQGVGFPAEGLALPGTSRNGPWGEEGRFGGWGLPLVYGIADQVEILPNLPHGTLIRAEKRVSAGLVADEAAVLPR